MKTLFTTFFLIFFAIVYSQNPYQIVDTTKDWNTMSMGASSWNIYHCGGTKTNKFEGEVVLDGETFLKVFESDDSLQENWEQVGVIREDTVNHLVYFENFEDDVGLLYDFGLTIGDTVDVQNFYTSYASTLVCENIDSVLLYGVYRNRYHFSAVYHQHKDAGRDDIIEVWIEGIGSLYGVLNSGFGGAGVAGGTRKLLCSSQNDTLIYMDTVYGKCYIDQFYPQIIQDEYDTAYLNTSYEFQLQIDSTDVDSFAVTGQVIPDGFIFDETTYLLSGTPDSTGLFACIITAKNKAYGFRTDIINTNIVVALPVGIPEKQAEASIRIYPNPFNSFLNISIETNNPGNYILELFTFDGKRIENKTIHTGTTLIDCARYKTGLYLYKLADDHGLTLKSGRIIKQ